MLEIRDVASSSSSVVRIPLDDIGGVSEDGGSLGMMMIMTSSGGRHKLETSGAGQRSVWISAIREGSKVLPPMLGFKQRVERERFDVSMSLGGC